MITRRPVIGFSSICFLLLVVSEVKGTLSPSGSISLDCGNQETFICSVTGTAAGWTITGLSGITVSLDSGLAANNTNARITTTDTSAIVQTSTITITGFTATDNRGVVQCINLMDGAVQGMATVSIGTPPCPIITTSTRNADFTAVTVTWSQPSTPPVPTTTVTYCPTSSPNCGNTMTCTSPCIISGLDPCINYSLIVTPSNNCGSAGCMMNMVVSPSKGVPDAPATFRVEGNDDCINASARWAASVSAMSTIISYCQLSNMNCESVLCGSSPCTISGLMNNEDYDFTVVHNNNCGNSSETTSLRTSPLRAPDHPVNFRVKANDDCTNARATWTASGTATSPNIFISYCPLTSSMNCGSVFCSSSPCTFYGLIRYQEYSITAVHNSSCGNSTVATQSQMSPLTNCLPVRVAAAIGAVIGSLAVVAVIITIVVIVVVCYCCPRARSVCCCCVSGGSKRSTSTEPMKPRPGEEYADPQKVRENKESGKQGGITYAALEFSEQAGSTGGQNVRSNKEEAVQYMAVEHA